MGPDQLTDPAVNPGLVLLSTSASSMTSLFVIACCALAGPLLSHLTRKRIPDVVWLLALGVAVGPYGLEWAATSEGVTLVRELGLGLLFLLAGFEVDTRGLRGRQGKFATLAWLISMVAAFVGAWALLPVSSHVQTAAALAIAVTSTALGTLLPILKESGSTDSPLGRAVLTHGAVGEVGPVVAMAMLLGSRSPAMTAAVFAIFILGALGAVFVPARVISRFPGIGKVIVRGTTTTQQTMLRAVFVLLTGLMALSAVLDLDIVLGAFVAGIIVRLFTPRGDHSLDRKLTTVAFSFLVPVFFVTSGMGIDIASVVRAWPVLMAMILIILIARGLPVWLLERFVNTESGISSGRDQLRLGLYAATGLPIIVAVTQVAVAQQLIPAELASVMVAAGAVTVLVFPLVAQLIAPDHEDKPLALVEHD